LVSSGMSRLAGSDFGQTVGSVYTSGMSRLAGSDFGQTVGSVYTSGLEKLYGSTGIDLSVGGRLSEPVLGPVDLGSIGVSRAAEPGVATSLGGAGAYPTVTEPFNLTSAIEDYSLSNKIPEVVSPEISLSGIKGPSVVDQAESLLGGEPVLSSAAQADIESALGRVSESPISSAESIVESVPRPTSILESAEDVVSGARSSISEPMENETSQEYYNRVMNLGFTEENPDAIDWVTGKKVGDSSWTGSNFESSGMGASGRYANLMPKEEPTGSLSRLNTSNPFDLTSATESYLNPVDFGGSGESTF